MPALLSALSNPDFDIREQNIWGKCSKVLWPLSKAPQEGLSTVGWCGRVRDPGNMTT